MCACVRACLNLSMFMIFDFPPMMDLLMRFLKNNKSLFYASFLLFFLQNLFNLLCQFRLTEAVTLAHSLNSHRLALIIAQASNPNLSSRLLLQQQLDEWNRLEVGAVYV